MKALYSTLACPHCGAKNFTIVSDDIFRCEYCNQKFNYDLGKVDFSAENKIFIEELKTEFYNKIEEIAKEKMVNKEMVVYYSRLANSRKLTTSLFIGILFFIALPS